MVTARELVDLDAVELTWKCLDEAESQPTIFLVQSMLTPGHRHATRRRRRRLRSTDAAVGTAAWHVVAQVGQVHGLHSQQSKPVFRDTVNKNMGKHLGSRRRIREALLGIFF